MLDHTLLQMVSGRVNNNRFFLYCFVCCDYAVCIAAFDLYLYLLFDSLKMDGKVYVCHVMSKVLLLKSSK